jgi:hypothetical protein
VLGDHPEVAVEGLGRVEEEARRPGRGEGRGDLLADQPRLADPSDDDVALGVVEEPDGCSNVSLASRARGSSTDMLDPPVSTAAFDAA